MCPKHQMKFPKVVQELRRERNKTSVFYRTHWWWWYIKLNLTRCSPSALFKFPLIFLTYSFLKFPPSFSTHLLYFFPPLFCLFFLFDIHLFIFLSILHSPFFPSFFHFLFIFSPFLYSLKFLLLFLHSSPSVQLFFLASYFPFSLNLFLSHRPIYSHCRFSPFYFSCICSYGLVSSSLSFLSLYFLNKLVYYCLSRSLA